MPKFLIPLLFFLGFVSNIQAAAVHRGGAELLNAKAYSINIDTSVFSMSSHFSDDGVLIPKVEGSSYRLIDTDFKIHQEFFNNISKHLTMDADIYLIENHYYQYMIDMATNNNLTLVGKYLMKNKTMQNGIILHFKPNT